MLAEAVLPVIVEFGPEIINAYIEVKELTHTVLLTHRKKETVSWLFLNGNLLRSSGKITG